MLSPTLAANGLAGLASIWPEPRDGPHCSAHHPWQLMCVAERLRDAEDRRRVGRHLQLPGESLAVEVGGSAEPVHGRTGDTRHKELALVRICEGQEERSEYGPSDPHPFGEPPGLDPEARDKAQPGIRSGLRWPV